MNVWSQNNSPAAAGVLGLIKKGNVLIVRGIAGNPVEQAFHDAAIADIKACPGVKVVGTIYGKWTNADANAEVAKWLAANPDVQVDAVIQHGIMMAGIIQGFQQAGMMSHRSAVAVVRAASCPGGSKQGDLQVGGNMLQRLPDGVVGVPAAVPHPGRPRFEGA